MTALLGVAASPASAERFPEGKGKPALTGDLKNQKHLVIHCQEYIEGLTETEFPRGTFRGVIVVLPNGTVKDVSPDGACFG